MLMHNLCTTKQTNKKSRLSHNHSLMQDIWKIMGYNVYVLKTVKKLPIILQSTIHICLILLVEFAFIWHFQNSENKFKLVWSALLLSSGSSCAVLQTDHYHFQEGSKDIFFISKYNSTFFSVIVYSNIKSRVAVGNYCAENNTMGYCPHNGTISHRKS